MTRHLVVLLILASSAMISAPQAECDVPMVLCSAQDDSTWIFRASYFSHDPETGKRIAQYVPEPTSYSREDPTYLESAYRHNQSILRGADGSADRLHMVQTWGKGGGGWGGCVRAGAANSVPQ